MMYQNNTLSEIWNNNQSIIPFEQRSVFDKSKSFCIQERDLRNSLYGSSLQKCWLNWKSKLRPQIIKNRAKKYSSPEFKTQKLQEYSRRAEDWNKLIYNLLITEDISPASHIIDVGSNEGEEVSNLNFKITCIEPSSILCNQGKKRFPNMEFFIGSADHIPIVTSTIDAYISLRTWCIAGVLPDEALDEAKRVLKPQGLIIVSFPVRYRNEIRTWENLLDDKITPILKWTFDLLTNELQTVKTLNGNEDLFLYGRLK